MMKILVTLIFAAIVGLAHAQPSPDTLWTRIAGGAQNDQINATDLTSDGGFVAAGQTRSSGAGMYDAYFLKYTSAGSLQWSRVYGGSRDDVINDIQQTSDGGYIAVGINRTVNSTGDWWVVRLNSSGDTLWTKLLGTSGAIEQAYGVQQTSDDGFIICGVRNSGGSQLYLVRYNSSGDTLWTRRIGGAAGAEVGHDLLITPDDGYLVVGYTASYGAGAEDIYLVRTNSSGDTLWTRTYGGVQQDVGKAIRPDNEGGYYICGNSLSTGFATGDLYLMRINSAGDTLWTRTAGIGSGAGEAVATSADGGVYLAGWGASFAGTNMYLLRYTSAGLLSWSRNYGGGAVEQAFDAEIMGDGGILLGGLSSSFGNLNEAYFVKTGPEGALNLLSPDGGEEWKMLVPHTVSWFSNAPASGVRIELNRDYPAGDWEVLAENIADDGSESLIIGGPASSICRIRVTQLPIGGSDISAGDFIIAPSGGSIALIELPDQLTPIYSWDAGAVECGTTAQLVTHVRNFGADTVIVFDAPPLTFPGFEVFSTCADSFVLAPGQYASCNIFVSFGNGNDGPAQDTLRFRTNASNAVNDTFRVPLSAVQYSSPANPDSLIIVGMQDSVKIIWGTVLKSSVGCVMNPPVPGYVVHSSLAYQGPFSAIDTVQDTFYVHHIALDTVRTFRVTALDPTP